MSRMSIEIVRGLREIKSDLGSPTVQWDNQTLTCIPKSNMDAMTLGLGGSSLSSDFTCIIPVENFTGPRRPVSKDLLFHGKIRYWIETVMISADGSYVRLECKLPESKA